MINAVRSNREDFLFYFWVVLMGVMFLLSGALTYGRAQVNNYAMLLVE